MVLDNVADSTQDLKAISEDQVVSMTRPHDTGLDTGANDLTDESTQLTAKRTTVEELKFISCIFSRNVV